jgi:hypothetical protein
LLAQAPIDSATASTAANFNSWRKRIDDFIPEPPRSRLGTVIRSTGAWLSERSVNLDEVLPDPFKCPRTAKSDRDG